jgi:hypothetical protein
MNRRSFAVELHRAMSMYRVGYRDLAWLMGARWAHWLREPIWDPRTGWFEGAPLPATREEETRVLELIREAQDNPEFWRRKHAEAKTLLGVYRRGLHNAQAERDRWRKRWGAAYAHPWLNIWEGVRAAWVDRWWKLKFAYWRQRG